MSTFAIGDIHGCYRTLRALLAQCGFDPAKDRLWCVGDLVNRGPRSRDVLLWAEELAARMGARFRCVLGNHDLHLLARAAGIAKRRASDTLECVLEAEDRPRLVAWLGKRPFAEGDEHALLVHAGLLPQWRARDALAVSGALQAAFGGPDRAWLLDRSSTPRDPRAAALKRWLAAFVTLRTCTPAGEPHRHNGPPDTAPDGYLPWFRVPGRRASDTLVLFGHWAALGLLVEDRLIGLDSGCVWGGALSAIRLEDRQVFSEPTHPGEAAD